MEKMKKARIENQLEKKRINIPAFTDLTYSETEDDEKLKGEISATADLSDVPKEVLESMTFDTTFKWPKKLPDGFNPEKLIEESKDPGLGIRRLHEQDITGRGVIVAIIDQKISASHSEFKDNLISNKEYNQDKLGIIDEETSMHGPAVASLLVGRNCGVAPDAKLYYSAKDTGKNSYFSYIEAVKDIIKYNKNHDQKIKVVSVSKGHQDIPGLKEWIEIKKEAKDLGIIVIDSNYFQENDITGGGSKTNKDQFDNYEVPLFYEDHERSAPSLEDLKNKLSTLGEDVQKQFFDKYKSYQNYIDTFNNQYLIVPSDYRSMASSRGDNEYRYEARGGWSWAIPYFAGVYALALQVKPNLKIERFLEIVRSTAGKNKKGVKVINPGGIIEVLK